MSEETLGVLIHGAGWVSTQHIDAFKNNVHAEVVAIRKAAKELGDFELEGCEIYASCEPCPMCLSAIYWARIPVVYYAADRHDAEKAGFDDSRIYEQLQKKIADRDIKMMQLEPEGSLDAFKKWNDQSDKTPY